MPSKDFNVPLMLDYYGNILTEKQREVIDLYYNMDLSLAEISEHAGITRQGVRDSIKRGEATLAEMEEKLGLASRIIKYEEAFGDMEQLVAELMGYTNLTHIKAVTDLQQAVEKTKKIIGDYNAF